MNHLEKTAYLRGLADGMKLSERDSDESRLLLAIIDAMEEMSRQIAAHGDDIGALSDDLEEMDDVLTSLEERMDGCEAEADEDEDEPVYQLDCPECGGPVLLTEAELDRGETECPACGAHLSIDVEEEGE